MASDLLEQVKHAAPETAPARAEYLAGWNAALAWVSDNENLEGVCRLLLTTLGEDPTRPGLIDTPRRWAAMWREFMQYKPGVTDTCFETAHSDQMVIVSGMRVWSLCEHHLLPFWCDVSIGYIADAKVIGLSKLGRIAHRHAHKLQIQEQLGRDIADEVASVVGTDDVAVLLRGEHLCMSMRGIRTAALMTSSVLRGRFKSDTAMRAEFMTLAMNGVQ